MRALRLVGGLLAAVVLLVIVTAIALLLWVDPNDYRDDIERLVEERTGRPLTIGGELDLTLFPWLALRVENVSLGNPPGFGAEPFLTVQRASVGAKLVPLLRGRLEVSRVAVDGLAVTLVSRGEEVNNWHDLGGKEEETGGGDAAPPTSIEGIDVTDSVLVYRDEAEGSTLRLSGLTVRTGPLTGGEPVQATVEFDYSEGEERPLAHVKLDAVARLPQGATRIELADVAVDGRWFGSDETERTAGDGTAEGEPLAFALRAPSIVLDWEAETLAPAELDAEVAGVKVRATVAGERLFGERLVTGKLSVPGVSPRDLMQSLGIEPPQTRDPDALTKLSAQGSYRLTQNALSISDLDLVLDDTRVRGTAGIRDLETGSLAFDLQVDDIDVDRYLEPEPAETSGGGEAAEAPPEEPTELPIEVLRELDAKGLLTIGRARLAGLEFTQVRLPVAVQGGIARAGPTQARLFGGSYAGNVMLDARQSQARLTLDEHVRGIDIGALAKAVFDSTRIEGRGNADAVLSGTGNTDAAILESLSGRLQANLEGGAITGVDLWYELRRARALLDRQAIPPREGPERTPFNRFSGSATLQEGVLRNEDLRIEMDYLRANGQGTLAIESGAIDYRLVAEIYRLPEDGAAAEMSDLKAAEIPITITGTLEEMKVRPDLESVVRRRVREEVDKRVEEKKEELKKKLEDKLKDIFGR